MEGQGFILLVLLTVGVLWWILELIPKKHRTVVVLVLLVFLLIGQGVSRFLPQVWQMLPPIVQTIWGIGGGWILLSLIVFGILFIVGAAGGG